MSQANSRWPRNVVLVGTAVAVAAVLVACGLWFGRASIQGATPEERMREIRDVARNRPWGTDETLARAAVSDADAACRQVALVCLAQNPSPKSRAYVEQATHDPSPGVRAAAAATLGLYHDDAALKRLSEMALDDAEPQVRLGAVTGLGRHRSPVALVWLLETAERDKELEVTLQAIATIYHRLGMRYIGAQVEAVDARTAALMVVENLKDDVTISKAYEKAGRAPVRNPQYYVPPLGEPDPRQGMR